MTVHAYKLVRFAAIEDHLRIGWMVAIPNAVMHHHHYGCEMQWICGCEIPFESKFVIGNVPITSDFHT